jgi:hypothetical protein
VRRLGRLFGLLGPVVGAALAGLACCAPGLAGYLAPVVFALLGVGGLYFLAAFEAPLAFGAALSAFVAWRQAPNRLARLGNGLLSVTAFLVGLTRLLWEVDPGLVMGLPPVYFLFIERQTILAPVAALALATALVAPLRTAAGAAWQTLRRLDSPTGGVLR